MDTNLVEGEKSGVRTLSKPATLLLCAAIAAGAALLITAIYTSEPKAERETAVRQTAMLVDVEPVNKGTYTPVITGLGTVMAAQDIELSPRVSGRVVSISEDFIPGGFVEEGETLLSLDPADYEYALMQQEAAFQQAESTLAQELGRRDVAKRDYEILGKTLQDKNTALALREPQLVSAQAALMSAEAMLSQAKLALARTKVTAPFNAQILSRSANVGSEVSQNTPVARLVGVDEYHVIVTLPLTKLEHVAFPETDGSAQPVEIRSRTAWPEGVSRTGELKSLIGAIDTETRLARVLVSVRDPLAIKAESGTPILIVGSIVQAHLRGKTLKDVVRINREYLRPGNTVWVMKDGALDIRNTEVLYSDTDYAYLASGLENGDLLVQTQLATVRPGVPLRQMGAK